VRALAPALVLAAALSAAASPATNLLVAAGGVDIHLTTYGPPPGIGLGGLREWVERSAGIVRAYYGQFPVPALDLAVAIDPAGAVVSGGKSFGQPQAHIFIEVGQKVSRETLLRDWRLIHEMIHLALPEVADAQNWLAEGLAVYVEGIARTQAGNMSATELWTEYLRDMPKGLPAAGDQGLDRTHSWARTYWGGALFCFVADVRIRSQTGGRRGLADALRAIARAGGGMREQWPVARILATGDAATGTSVLATLYSEMALQPGAPDLGRLFRDLGVEAAGDQVKLDDAAPMAAIRRAITQASDPVSRD
jgi:hypothetical protein